MRILLTFLLLSLLSSAQLRVASFNPIATDLLRIIGGEQLTIVEIVKPGSDIHQFRPKARDLKKLPDCTLIFAMGKNLEPYLDGISDSLSPDQKIVEIGRSIPSHKIDSDPLFVCCPNHSVGSVDPHWWHNVKNMERAAKVVARELKSADPENSKLYNSRSKTLRSQYRNLHNWVKSEIDSIPKEQRVLVTPHGAFAYFCREYDMKTAFLQGLSRDGEISSRQLADTIVYIREKQIKAIFPEQHSNPKVLKQIAREAGCKIGKPLFADEIDETYESTIRRNVRNMVAHLR